VDFGVTEFLATAPALDTSWRAVVLFGRNVASYKFALAKTLLGLAECADDRVPLEGARCSLRPTPEHLPKPPRHNGRLLIH
jgi:hypothetical protein